jgi:hypothetical protein
MNLAHAGNLNKLARATDLQKDHRYRAGLSIKALAEIIAEADPDNAAAVHEMLHALCARWPAMTMMLARASHSGRLIGLLKKPIGLFASVPLRQR